MFQTIPRGRFPPFAHFEWAGLFLTLLANIQRRRRRNHPVVLPAHRVKIAFLVLISGLQQNVNKIPLAMV